MKSRSCCSGRRARVSRGASARRRSCASWRATTTASARRCTARWRSSGWIGLDRARGVRRCSGSACSSWRCCCERARARAVVPGPFFSSAVLATLRLLHGGSSGAEEALAAARSRAARRSARWRCSRRTIASTARGVDARAAQTRGGYPRSSGTKLFVTDAHVADVLVVACRTTGQRRGRRHAVPRAARHAGRDGDAAADRSTSPAGRPRSRFENVELPKDAVLGTRGQGLEGVARVLDVGRDRPRRRQPRRRRTRARDGGRVRQGARAVRQPDRLVPGRQAHRRRDGQRDRAGALAGLVRRLRVRRAAARGAARRVDGQGAASATSTAASPTAPCRSTAASASPGSTTSTSGSSAPSGTSSRSGMRRTIASGSRSWRSFEGIDEGLTTKDEGRHLSSFIFHLSSFVIRPCSRAPRATCPSGPAPGRAAGSRSAAT